ncbi:MAG: alpha/beta hydrolase, partial [Dokdonella sp.]
SERLRKLFISRYGKPKRTFAMGYSMGGLLTVHALETQPKVYAGGLALCGALAPSDTMMQRAFSVRAAFDHYFPGLLGALDPVPSDYMPDRKLGERVDAAMRANPTGSAAVRALAPATTEDHFPGVVAFITYVIKEMQQRAGANPFDNSDHVYVGTTDDIALNAGVTRYRADADAARYLIRWHSPTGKLERPLLALHTSGDPLVPASIAFDYALLTRKAERAHQFVQQYVPLEGHCTMTPEQTVGAFDDLVAWVGGTRPASGLRH